MKEPDVPESIEAAWYGIDLDNLTGLPDKLTRAEVVLDSIGRAVRDWDNQKLTAEDAVMAISDILAVSTDVEAHIAKEQERARVALQEASAKVAAAVARREADEWRAWSRNNLHKPTL